MSKTDAEVAIHSGAPQNAQTEPAASLLATERRALAELRHQFDQVRHERDRLVEVVAQQRVLIAEQRAAYNELVRGLAEVKAGLAENRELARRYGMLDLAANAERDPASPLQ